MDHTVGRQPPNQATRSAQLNAALQATAVIVGLTLACSLIVLAIYTAGVSAWARTPRHWPLLSNPARLVIITAGGLATLTLWAAWPRRRQ